MVADRITDASLARNQHKLAVTRDYISQPRLSEYSLDCSY